MLAAAALGASAVVRNNVIRRRLRFSVVSLVALAALHLAAHASPPLVAFANEDVIERLLLAFAAINAGVAVAFNPWFQDRVFDRSPAIVQDALVVGIFGLAAVFLLKDSKFLTASAIVAAAVGFALQDTLANAFAGLAIQTEKPFKVGHWISVANYEGAVAEVTWRATKIRTKAGNLVIIPNNIIAKDPINNYSEPALPTRAAVEVGADYAVPPNEVRDALLTAVRRVTRVLPTPEPDALLQSFGDSAIIYQARFWLVDFSQFEQAKSEVRRAIYYEFRRRNISIPWPITVEYKGQWPADDQTTRRSRYAGLIAAAPAFAALPREAHDALAAAAVERLFADGEAIVREAEPGSSMFFVQRGRVAITVGPDHRQVAMTEAGGFFGEMSLLTGAPRSATVRASGDVALIEIDAESFGEYVRRHPDTVDLLAAVATARRREIDAARAEQTSAPADAGTLVQRIRKFFRLGDRPGAAPR